MSGGDAARDRHGAHDVSSADHRVEAVPAAVFWGLTVLGLAVMGFGVYGIVANQGTGVLDVRVRPIVTWTLAAIVLHDLVFAPLVLVVGRGLRHARPLALRAPLQAGLATTVLVSLLAFPLIRGYGARAAAPSRLPLNYTMGYLALLAVIWTTCGVWAWYRHRVTPTRWHARVGRSHADRGDR